MSAVTNWRRWWPICSRRRRRWSDTKTARSVRSIVRCMILWEGCALIQLSEIPCLSRIVSARNTKPCLGSSRRPIRNRKLLLPISCLASIAPSTHTNSLILKRIGKSGMQRKSCESCKATTADSPSTPILLISLLWWHRVRSVATTPDLCLVGLLLEVAILVRLTNEWHEVSSIWMLWWWVAKRHI